MSQKKYPRTPHLPWSPGASTDDERVVDVSAFVGRYIIVTEKLDGECTTINRKGTHARSLDTAPHPSRTWVRALAGGIHHVIGQIHPDLQIVGENVFAEHSIHYDALPSYFCAFAARLCPIDSDTWGGEFKSWEWTVGAVRSCGLALVPVLYEGIWDAEKVRECYTGISQYGGQQEGYVVRVEDSFRYEDFNRSVAKYVRADHVQTDEHWLSKPVVKNGLR